MGISSAKAPEAQMKSVLQRRTQGPEPRCRHCTHRILIHNLTLIRILHLSLEASQPETEMKRQKPIGRLRSRPFRLELFKFHRPSPPFRIRVTLHPPDGFLIEHLVAPPRECDHIVEVEYDEIGCQCHNDGNVPECREAKHCIDAPQGLRSLSQSQKARIKGQWRRQYSTKCQRQIEDAHVGEEFDVFAQLRCCSALDDAACAEELA